MEARDRPSPVSSFKIRFYGIDGDRRKGDNLFPEGNKSAPSGDSGRTFLEERFARGYPGHAGYGALHGLKEEIEMSQRNRIVPATLALVATLSLTAPAPSHAAGLQVWGIPAIDVLDQAWDWVARILPAKEGGAADPNGKRAGTSTSRRGVMPEKEGGMADPNGGRVGAPAPVPTVSAPQTVAGGK